MPYSYSKFKKEVADHIIRVLNPQSEILDVGAGSGVYCDLLRHNFANIDALEIFPQYIEMFNLRGKYKRVHLGDIRAFNIDTYDYIIMGDILEHLSYGDALKVLDKINVGNKKALIAVPYLYVQGEEFGNIYETHLQPDLTRDIMKIRYPMLHLLYGDDNYGYYINYTA